MTAPRLKILVAFLSGFTLACILNWFACWYKPESPGRYILTADLDLESSYYVKRQDPSEVSPLVGVIKAGSKFNINHKKADINYVTFFTLVPNDVLMPISMPVEEVN